MELKRLSSHLIRNKIRLNLLRECSWIKPKLFQWMNSSNRHPKCRCLHTVPQSHKMDTTSRISSTKRTKLNKVRQNAGIPTLKTALTPHLKDVPSSTTIKVMTIALLNQQHTRCPLGVDKLNWLLLKLRPLVTPWHPQNKLSLYELQITIHQFY